jgi:formate hydrogenlyase transcriptional activator
MPSSIPIRPHATGARYETLLEVAESIAAHRQLATLFADLSRCLRRLVSFDFINLTLLDAKNQVFRLHILQTDREVVGEAPPQTPFDQSPSGLALRTRQPYVVADVSAAARFPVLENLLRANRVQSYCVLPLYTAQRDLGGLSFGSLEQNAYSAEDIEFIQQVAKQVAVAVDNALNHEAARAYEEQLKLERDRLSALLEINNAVVTCLASKPLFQAISASLRRTFGLDYASLLIYDPEISALRLETCDFPAGFGAMREDAVVPVGDTVAGYVFRTREGRVFTLEEASAISKTTGDIMAREGVRSICCMPLISHNSVLGTLNLGSRQEAFFSDGDLQFFSQAAGQVAIALENAFSYQRIEELNARLAEEKVYLEDEIRTDNRFEEIVGQSRVLKAVLKQVETVAPTDSTVLIYGETGTGKELLARAIHDLSSRRQGTFVKLNCAAIPTGLLESEMFGHEKGAFTGAIAQRIGRFELAHRGSMFLDEVGEIPLELQTKLLRVLQEREFERLGSSRTIRTDARLVAATNRNLAELVEERQFRADLYYRLNVFNIAMPPLREHLEDLPPMVEAMVSEMNQKHGRKVSGIAPSMLDRLMAHSWPGNARELRNTIERAVILCPDGAPLDAGHLPQGFGKDAAAASSDGSSITVRVGATVDEAERLLILRTLEATGQNKTRAAEILGVSLKTLHNKLKEYGRERHDTES